MIRAIPVAQGDMFKCRIGLKLKLKKKTKTKEEKDDWKQEDDDNTFYSIDHSEQSGGSRGSSKGVEEDSNLHKTGVH
tara:strand:+ start:87 stop:317 length:231 start_codon:yes stop_codon:yes gene_type:complete